MSIISNYLGPIHSAVLVFPLLALVLAFPYIMYEYRHYGAIPLIRTIIVYTMILYLICAFFEVILPLPSRQEVAASSAPAMQTDPGNFIRMIRETVDFDIHDRSTWKETLKNKYVYQAILNFILLFPFGIYLRYYFRRGFITAFIFTALMALFFEWTQLSGLHGWYAHAYRTFDVDDIILNTTGGILGWLVAPLFCLFLPSRDKIDGTAYERGTRIPMFRRFLSFVIDFGLISALEYGLSLLIPNNAFGHLFAVLSSMVFSVAYFTFMPTVSKGYTLGSALFRLRLVTGFRRRGQPASQTEYLIHALLLSLLIAHLPHYWVLCQDMKQITTGGFFNFWKNFQLLTQIGMALFIIEVLVRNITGDRIFFYERISGVHNESTIKYDAGDPAPGGTAPSSRSSN